MKNPYLPFIERTNFFGIPLDFVSPEQFKDCSQSADTLDSNRAILLLSFPLFIATLLSKKKRAIFQEACLVIPQSRIISKGYAFVSKKKIPQYDPFHFIIKFLAALEGDKKTLYLLGGTGKELQHVQSNIKISFPHLLLVGRYKGFFSHQEEPNIALGIKKAHPAVLLGSRGLRKGYQWFYSQRESLNPGYHLWSKTFFPIITGKRKRIPVKPMQRFFYHLSRGIRRPWRIYMVFPYLWFKLALILHRLKGTYSS